MKILFDLSYIRLNPYAGVSKYAYRILDYIVKEKKCDNYILIVNIVAEKFLRDKYPQFDTIVIGNHRLLKIPILRTLWCSWHFKSVVNKSSADLLFCPWANEITCLKNKKKMISVIHDVQSMIDNHGIKRLIYRQIFSLIVSNSDEIVTISNFSVGQIKNYFPGIKIKIVNLGNSVSYPESILYPPKWGGKYLLYVGRICKMKNVITLVKAFSRIHTQFPNYKLLIVGETGLYWKEEILPIIESTKISNKVVCISNCTEEELYNLYKYAKIFIFPSLREGFGSPPLEAAIMGTPVISTKCDSLFEVTRGLLYYYDDPLDDLELSSVITSVLNNYPSLQKLDSIKQEYLDNYSTDFIGSRICNYLYNCCPTKICSNAGSKI